MRPSSQDAHADPGLTRPGFNVVPSGIHSPPTGRAFAPLRPTFAPLRPTPLIRPVSQGILAGTGFTRPEFTPEDVFRSDEKAEAFLQDYLRRESAFFAIARDPVSKLTRDGVMVDPATGIPNAVRAWSAPSKECLDIAICIKALQGDPRAAVVVSKPAPDRAADEATAILAGKMTSYERWYAENPGYGGFLPWFKTGAEISPTDDWVGDAPGLDNGEWVWTMLVAEDALRASGNHALADRYQRYNELLRSNAVRMFYDAEAGKVRGDVHIVDPKSAGSGYESIYNKPGRMTHLTGEHGVHEGAMMVMYVTLFGEGLPEGAADRVWRDIEMERREHTHGTTWNAFWGSSHESWAYLFLPYRQIPGYAQLFRIREEVRTQNAAERQYPGLASSTNDPRTEGYLSAAGIEGIGSQPVLNNDTFAVYAAFPLLLEQAARGHHGLAWLVNMLHADGMYGPLGGGESGTNDGRHSAPMKTIDGSFPNLIALMGGLENETAAMLARHGRYDRFKSIVSREFEEGFGSIPLREPSGFALPSVQVPTNPEGTSPTQGGKLP